MSEHTGLIERLRTYRGGYFHEADCIVAATLLERREAENAKLRACVELYADVNSWNSTGYIWLPTDKGYEPAQKCLEELK